MPTYSAQCTMCQHKFDIFRRIDDRNKPANCEKCGQLAERVIDKARVVADYAPYQCPITGDTISGRKAHEENLKKHGCRVYEPGEFEDHKRFRAQQEELAMEQITDRAVEAALALPVEKQEILAGELLHGAGTGDCGFVRQTLTD